MDTGKIGTLAEEQAKLATLKSDFAAAEGTYLSELKRDLERNDGSVRQDLLNDARLEKVRNAEIEAKAKLDAQQEVVDQLTKQQAVT